MADSRVAIVTGTSPNIGGGIAEAFAQAGIAVALLDVDSANVEDGQNAIRAAGGRALGIQCDITDPARADQAIDAIEAEWGRIDILINNAAAFGRAGLLDMPLADWQRQLSVMLDGTFVCSQIAARKMVARKQGGVIINIGSTAGHQGEPGNIAYSTAKSALLNFTRSAAMELARHRIRVNSLTPTATDPRDARARARRWGRDAPETGLSPVSLNFLARIPLGELPTPMDYGEAALFLASDAARMITGIDLRVDGGAVAKYWGWDPPRDA